MAAVGAAVVAPRSSVQKVTCFQGPTGSTEPCRAASTADGASFAGTRPFATGEQLSIVTALQPGAAVYVVGVHEGDGRSGTYFDRFPDGVVYTIEYEGGAAAEIHESDLTAE